MAATRFHPTSPTPRRPPLAHPSRSYPLRCHDESDSETSASDTSDQGEEADAQELPRVRARAFAKSGWERQTKTNRKRMASHTHRRHSDSKTYSVKEPRLTVREIPRRQSSGHRSQRHRADTVDFEEVDVYVHRRRKSSKHGADDIRPGLVRRSTTTDDATRPRQAGSWADKEPSRRPSVERGSQKHSDRPSVYRHERVFTPIRHEKRSTVEDVAQVTRDRREKLPLKR